MRPADLARAAGIIVVATILAATLVETPVASATPASSTSRASAASVSADAAILPDAARFAPVDAAVATTGTMQTVIVTLRSQAAIPAAPRGADRRARLREVVNSLRAAAASGQTAIQRTLRMEMVRGHVARIVPFWVFNGLSITATPA